MSHPTIPRDVAAGVANYIEVRRAELVAAVVRSPALPQGRSSTASTLANAFFDRLVREFEAADAVESDGWIDRVVSATDVLENAQIVAIGCAVLTSSYCASTGGDDEVIAYLAIRAGDLDRALRAPKSDRSQVTDLVRTAAADDVVSALLSAIESRDSATCDHSRAVGMWCGRIAKMIGMDANEQKIAVLSGTLHDIGKVATPSDVLLKPGPLDAREWEIMKMHSLTGAQILERIPSLAPLAPIVLAHHERIDGGGYPNRLVGDAIPLMARIVGVADSFHAMISKRPYRRPLPVPAALEELRKSSGTQWDPLVVDAMLAIVQPAGAAQRALRVVRVGER